MSIFKYSPAYQLARLGKKQLDERKKHKTASSTMPAEPNASDSMNPNVPKQELIMPLKERGEKILGENLSPEEKVVVKLQGQFGQALVMTDKRLYVVKWGMQAGSTFGGTCTAYEYRNITAIEVSKHATSRFIQILTPANQGRKLSYWASSDKPNSAIASDCAITFSTNNEGAFQEAVSIARRITEKLHQGTSSYNANDGSLDQLEKLAELKQKGIITEDEFRAKEKATAWNLNQGLIIRHQISTGLKVDCVYNT